MKQAALSRDAGTIHGIIALQGCNLDSASGRPWSQGHLQKLALRPECRLSIDDGVDKLLFSELVHDMFRPSVMSKEDGTLTVGQWLPFRQCSWGAGHVSQSKFPT